MKRLALIFGLIFALAGSASAQQILTSSPVYNGLSAPPLAINVNQFSEFNVLLMANAPIVISAPVVKGSIPFRINTCQDTSGGWTPTFSATGGLTIVNRVGPNITTTTPGACDTEFWTYQAATGTLILQSVSLNSPPAPTGTGFPLTGNVTANGWKIQNQGPGTGVGDGLVFGQAGAQLTNCLLLNGTTSGGANLCVEAVGGFTLFQFPATNGTPGQALVTDGTGVTSWATVGGGGGSSFPLTGDVSAAGHKIQNQGVGTVSGDGIVFGLSHLNDLAPATNLYSMNGFKIQGLAAATVTNDAIAYGQAAAFLLSGTITAAAINNIKTVTAPPYNAVGDGVADDTIPIQSAIYDACNMTNPPTGTPLATATAIVYLPKPTVCYEHTLPLRIPCQNLQFYGDGITSKLCQNYWGSAILQSPWGSPGTLPYDTSLVTGTGHSLASPDGGQLPKFIDLSHHTNATGTNTLNSKLATGFFISFFWKPGAGTNGNRVFSSENSYPGTGAGAFGFFLNQPGKTMFATVNTLAGGHTFGNCPAQSVGTVYQNALDWDGTTYRWWQGVPGSPSTLCDSFVSSSRMTQGIFEENLLPDGGSTQYWPDGSSTSQNPAQGDIDGVDIEIGSQHTSSYIVPTIKPTRANSTFLLENFQDSLDGTQYAQWGDGSGGSGNIYYNIYGANQISYTSGAYIHDMEMCSLSNGGAIFGHNPEGLLAADGNNSIWQNLVCSNGSYDTMELGTNDYLSQLINYQGFGGHVGPVFGPAWNDSIDSDTNVDLVDGACEVYQGGGGGDHQVIRPHCVDRGSLRYAWIEDGSQAIYEYPFVDQENSNTNWLTTFLLNGPAGPYHFNSGNIDTRNGGPYVIQDGSGPGSIFTSFIFNSFGASTPASEVIHFTGSAPSIPYRLINPDLPTANSGSTAKVPLTNLGPETVILDDGPNIPVLNDTGTGTTVNKLVKFTSAPSKAVILATTDLTAVGVCKRQCGTAGASEIQNIGPSRCTFDATSVVAGDWVQISSTTAGDCHDSGVSSYTSNPPAGFVVGIALVSGAGSADYSINLALASTPSILANYGHITNITNAASPYSVLGTDYFISCNATAGATVITMPLATGTGRQLIIKKSDSSANACTISRQGGDLIDGATTAVDGSQYQSFSLMDTGSAVWSIF